MGDISIEPYIRILARGWFAFMLKTKNVVSWVLEQHWSMAAIPLILKHWTPFFNAQRKKVDKELVYFPMIYWNMQRFRAISNRLGEFMDVDMSFRDSGRMTVARVLVKMDFKKGLPPDIGIVTSSSPPNVASAPITTQSARGLRAGSRLCTT